MLTTTRRRLRPTGMWRQRNDTGLRLVHTNSHFVLVFAVVLFFWMAFHQNGLTLTYFADEFTAKSSEVWRA